ncbi:MAG: MlaA family lipoprotein, partial [Pantoea piersonii]
MAYRLTSLVLASVMLAGCASSKPDSEAPAQRSDPLEGFNRTMFNFNYNVLDPYVLRPVAVAWRDYVPVPARTGLSNFLGNLEEPASMVNSIL